MKSTSFPTTIHPLIGRTARRLSKTGICYFFALAIVATPVVKPVIAWASSASNNATNQHNTNTQTESILHEKTDKQKETNRGVASSTKPPREPRVGLLDRRN